MKGEKVTLDRWQKEEAYWLVSELLVQPVEDLGRAGAEIGGLLGHTLLRELGSYCQGGDGGSRQL